MYMPLYIQAYHTPGEEFKQTLEILREEALPKRASAWLEVPRYQGSSEKMPAGFMTLNTQSLQPWI